MTILIGMVVCMLLPLIEVTVHQKNLLHIPLQTIQQILQEDEEVLVEKSVITEWEVQDVRQERGLSGILGGVYLIGFSFIFIYFGISTYRMYQLIRNSKKRKWGKYWLSVVQQPIGSFSWGKYIVISDIDYGRCSKEVLLHEMMHIRNFHTIDLFLMQLLLLFQWFNPVVWLLKRELQEIHEYEADNGVINTGIDATKYQLLLVKKAVGTRLYSMANGFNHSKLKNRITMMLKKRTSRWACLKLLLFAPLMGGTLYVFARPEVKQTLEQTVVGVQQQSEDDYLSLIRFFESEKEAYSQLNGGKKPDVKMIPLYINLRNQVMFNGDKIDQNNLKPAIVKVLRASWEKSGRKQMQAINYISDRGSDVYAIENILRIVKSAYEEINEGLKSDALKKGEEYQKSLFPALVYEGIPKNYGTQEKPKEIITGVTVTLNDAAGKKIKLENFTLDELKNKLKEIKASSIEFDKLVVGLKVDEDCKIGVVTDVKNVLRNSMILKINYDTDGKVSN